ncbi:MAG: hypothetical protein EAZ91_02595 [Cytophagales bacterium]|nr:MAG: hypothetical protein EAZ91_02595 [Cytophagales bacterium]
MQLTLEVPDQHVPFFKDLVKHLNFPVMVEDDETDDEPSPEQLKAEMRQAVAELKLVRQGKLKSRPIADVLNEL